MITERLDKLDADVARAFVEAIARGNESEALRLMQPSVSCGLLGASTYLRLPRRGALAMADFRHSEHRQPVAWGVVSESDRTLGYIEFAAESGYCKRWHVRLKIRDRLVTSLEARWSAPIKEQDITSAA
jgi:hypothetical protein